MYDMIIVGSGNGACGFLSCYLEANPKTEKILVVEEGQDFFDTSDITHQKSWSKSYLAEEIYKLHQAFTPEETPIVTGRACTMGGGGSINYTMIHESSEWLAKHLGRTESYWDGLKQELNQRFERSDPTKNLSSVTKHVVEKARAANFQLSSIPSTYNIPNHQEGDVDLLHIFTTQFNRFGQRTNSGVSIVNWNDSRIELKTYSRVIELKFAEDEKPARCVGVNVKNLVTGEIQLFSLTPKGRLILCAGAATPRLLMPYRKQLQNWEIGKYVNDHIAIPLGVYILDRQTIDATQRDNYLPVFATTVWKKQEETTCTFDFFAGDIPELLYFFPQLYFPFLVPNWLEKMAIAKPWLFYLIKNFIKELIRFINLLINLWWSFSNLLKGKSWRHRDLPLITAVLKFSAAQAGYYLDDGQIRLKFFSEDEDTHFNRDKEVAKYAIKQHLAMINTLGKQPSWIFKFLLQAIAKIPYKEHQIDRYIEATSKYFLSTEQHLSGGCLFDKAIDLGVDNPKDTGKLHGSGNIYVADLSATPLPRISPQMTAYLIGFHVAKTMYGNTQGSA